jgi:cytochrome c oxidase cbb3-type subunit 3
MSDFFSNGWSWYVAIATVAGLVFCLLLLLIASRHKVMAGDNSTGHVWDEDLRELNNPLPRWWAILFVLTVVFAGVYLAIYPGLGSRAGTLGWTSVGEYEQEQDEAAHGDHFRQIYRRCAAAVGRVQVGQRKRAAPQDRPFIPQDRCRPLLANGQRE